MMLSFTEPANPGFVRRIFKCVACEYVEDVKVRIGQHFRTVSRRRLATHMPQLIMKLGALLGNDSPERCHNGWN
jgi:hypothetical protein